MIDLSLEPEEILVEAGHDLEVNCTLSGDLHIAHVNASMLDVSLTLSSDHVRSVLNERTLKVVFLNLHRRISHQQVFCSLPAHNRYAQSTVVVAGLLKSFIV